MLYAAKSERRDVASMHPDVVERLTQQALTWHKSLPPRDVVAQSGKPPAKVNQGPKKIKPKKAD